MYRIQREKRKLLREQLGRKYSHLSSTASATSARASAGHTGDHSSPQDQIDPNEKAGCNIIADGGADIPKIRSPLEHFHILRARRIKEEEKADAEADTEMEMEMEVAMDSQKISTSTRTTTNTNTNTNTNTMLKVGKKRKIKQEIMHQILSQEDETNIQNYMILTQQNNTGADVSSDYRYTSTCNNQGYDNDNDNDNNIDINSAVTSQTPKRQKRISFEERIQQLAQFQQQHGHINLKKLDDDSLYHFLNNVRSGRRNPGIGIKMTKERIQALDAFGFDWLGSDRDRRQDDDGQGQDQDRDNVMHLSKESRNEMQEQIATAAPDLIPSSEKSLSIQPNSHSQLSTATSTSTSTSSPTSQTRKMVPFEMRIAQLHEYKQTHGHLRVNRHEDENLYRFIINIRSSFKNGGNIGIRITPERIQALKLVGLDLDIGTGWGGNNITFFKFAERLEQLKAFKLQHGHLSIKVADDKSLYNFGNSIRHARRHPGRTNLALTEEKIRALDEIGFLWEKERLDLDTKGTGTGGGGNNIFTFEERLEQLKAFKLQHGHLSIKVTDDESLYNFCKNFRYAGRHPGRSNVALTEEKIRALNEIGFLWKKERNNSSGENNAHFARFMTHVEQLKEFKEQHGHLVVKSTDDQKLFQFCHNVRYAYRNPGKGMILPSERIQALNDIGFVWDNGQRRRTTVEKSGDGTKSFVSMTDKPNTNAFQKRVDDLKAFKERYGHLLVKRSDDKSLYIFCNNIKRIRRSSSRSSLTKERIRMLDELGFDWGASSTTNSNSDSTGTSPIKKEKGGRITFEERVKQLKTFKDENGHLLIRLSDGDNSLQNFIRNIRYARRNADKGGGMVITEARIKALDELGFSWDADNHPNTNQASSASASSCATIPKKFVKKSFNERIEELKIFKGKHGHLQVWANYDTSLFHFCVTMRCARRKPEGSQGFKLTDERIRALDDIGFEWTTHTRSTGTSVKTTFGERIVQLKAFKETNGHLSVRTSDDRNLYQYCNSVRYARRNPGMGLKLTEDKIKALDDIGFPWGCNGGSLDAKEKQSSDLISSELPSASPSPLKKVRGDHNILDSVKFAKASTSAIKLNNAITCAGNDVKSLGNIALLQRSTNNIHDAAVSRPKQIGDEGSKDQAQPLMYGSHNKSMRSKPPPSLNNPDASSPSVIVIKPATILQGDIHDAVVFRPKQSGDEGSKGRAQPLMHGSHNKTLCSSLPPSSKSYDASSHSVTVTKPATIIKGATNNIQDAIISRPNQGRDEGSKDRA